MNFTSLDNLERFLNKLSFATKESGVLNSIINSYLNDFKDDLVRIVQELPQSGEDGILYLVPQGNDRFIEYYYTNNEWIQLGSSVFDYTVDSTFSNNSTNTIQNSTIKNALDSKLNANQVVNALNDSSNETPQSGVLYNSLEEKLDSSDFLNIQNSDINKLFFILNSSKFACSNGTTWYINGNDDLYGWGYNDYGQQGAGTSGGFYRTFTKRASNVKKVVCSYYATWYIDNNNDLYGCGGGFDGQQGNGKSGNNANVLTFTKRASNVKDVFCSIETTWYLTVSGDLYGCGYNEYGQQGNGESGKYSKVLTFTKRAENVKNVFCSSYTTWYIDNNNDLYGCGYNNQGQQGNGSTSNISTFTKRAENVKDAFCSEYNTFYVDNNNDLYRCGNDTRTFTKIEIQ